MVSLRPRVRIPVSAPKYVKIKSLAGVLKWSTRADCKSAGIAYTGSNPVPSTISRRSSVGQSSCFVNSRSLVRFQSSAPTKKLTPKLHSLSHRLPKLISINNHTPVSSLARHPCHHLHLHSNLRYLISPEIS